MILILSDKNDVHADRVENILKEEVQKYFRLNLDVESLKKSKVTFVNGYWKLWQNGAETTTREIKTVWARRVYVELLLEEKSITNSDFQIWKGEWNKTLLGIYAFLEDRNWLNFYRDSYYAENKYRQFIIAQNLGFKIPDFISSNDKLELERVREFKEESRVYLWSDQTSKK